MTDAIARKLEQARKLAAARDPLAKRMQQLNEKTGLEYGTAVKQGRFQGTEGLGKNCRPVTGWFESRSDCVEALEALA